jgi:thiol:disulfide interchange protein DsbC
MKYMGRWAAAASLCVAAGVASGTEAEIRQAVETLYPTAKVSAVNKTRVAGLFEVVVGQDVVYADERGKTLFYGTMVDVERKANITEERKSELSAIKFDDLPLNMAVKVVKGNGSRSFATFEDPNCGYCKKLHTGLKSLTDYTHYVFLIPMLGPDSKVKTQQILCSPDKSRALSEWMTVGATIPGGQCDAQMDKLLDLSQRLGVTGTPTIFFSNGKRSPGYLSSEQMERMLAEASRRPVQ